MVFTNFDQQNYILAENQEEYENLPVNINPDLPECPMCFCVQLTPVDIGRLKQNGGALFFNQLTFGKNFQPVSVGFEPPETISKLSKEEVVKSFERIREEEEKQKNLKSRLPIKLLPREMADTSIKLLPFMPNGDPIPNIVKGSMEISFDHDLVKAGLGKLSLEVFFDIADLNGLNLTEVFNGTIKGSM